MSDGSTDVHRDSLRSEAYADFMFLVAIYLERPLKKHLKAIRSAAKTCDAIPRGYWSSPTALSKNLDEWLENLRAKKAKQWLQLLLGCQNVYLYEAYKKWDRSLYAQLKSMSPYADKTIVVNKYGYGFANIYGELQDKIDEWVKNEGMCVRQADSYALIFDALPPPQIEWLGHFSEKTPFKSDRKER